MDLNMSDFGLWSGVMMSLCEHIICSVVNMVCCGRINGYNTCMWNLSIMSYLWGGGNYTYVVTWNGLNMNHDDLSCGVSKNVIVTWNDFTCPSPHGGVWNLTWHGGFCMVWIDDALLVLPKEVSCMDNSLQCDYTDHTQNI